METSSRCQQRSLRRLRPLARRRRCANASDTNQFTQMEGNFSLFWGLSVQAWVNVLVPDNTPFDQFLDANPDAFAALGEPGEPGLVEDQLNCSQAPQSGRRNVRTTASRRSGTSSGIRASWPSATRSGRAAPAERPCRTPAEAARRERTRSAARAGHLLRLQPVAQEPQLQDGPVRRVPCHPDPDRPHHALHQQDQPHGRGQRVRRRRASSSSSSRSPGSA